MKNIPNVALGIIAVSRDCFPIALSERRRNAVVDACKENNIPIITVETIVETETDMLKAVAEAKEKGCNALVVFLGNFGPETPETLIAQTFDGPVMYVAAAEETKENLMLGRGDAFCGMLNCSYNLGLRNIPAVLPEYPVGGAAEIAEMILDFFPVARTVLGLQSLKIITFGPRPQDFFACNAPIKGLYDLGVEVQENSELDLLMAYKAHEGDTRIPKVVASMEEELGEDGNTYPDLLPRMAQFELTLLDWMEENKGARDYVVFANKCWPAFPQAFGFEPCYVNSRLATRGIPVACEVDIYGALSEFIATCITQEPVTLLDINNTVPKDLYTSDVQGTYDYENSDLFMGFHCGNTPHCRVKQPAIKYQLIQNQLLEDGGTPDFTRGTLEGDLAENDITLFRLHANPDGSLQSYISQGEILPVPTHSFGGIGVIGIPEMARFYRHVLLEHRFPHHAAIAFSHIGKPLHTVLRYLGIERIHYNQPKHLPYPTENPFG